MHGLVLFDIDGTLLMPGDHDHQAAFVHAMQQVYGVPATLEGVPLSGMLDNQIARLALNRHGLSEEAIDAQLATMVAVMGERYAAAVAGASRIERLLPGVVEAAERLQQAELALGVLTGNIQAVARVKLAAAGIDRFFPFGAYGDTARERSQLVEEALRTAHAHHGVAFTPAQTVLVGDTPRDIEAARLGGARVLAVATGRFGLDELDPHQPDALLPDLSDPEAVLRAVEGMLGESSSMGHA